MATYNITPIDAISFESSYLTSQDQSLVGSIDIQGNIYYGSSKIEVWVYDLNKTLVTGNLNTPNWSIPGLLPSEDSSEYSAIDINVQQEAEEFFLEEGEYNFLYNFTHYELLSSPDNQYYITDISSDRTEIRIASNTISNDSLKIAYETFKDKLSQDAYFDDFYLNFNNNVLELAVNILLDQSKNQYGLFIKLYEPLPSNINVKNQLWVVTETADSVAYNVVIENPITVVDNLTPLSGPNTSIGLKNLIGNSNLYANYESLSSSSLSSSKDQLQSYLEEESLDINIDYNDYSNFVFYSSAANRLSNFYSKAKEIEDYTTEINALNLLTSTPQVSSSISLIEDKISEITKKFDGYEYFLYYNSGSKSWPKTNSSPPYTLASTGSAAVLSWYGSNTYGSTYYGGQYYSASYYDKENENILTNLVPTYLQDYDSQQYLTFLNMIGQSFDNVWVYTKNITEKLNADNRLDYGAAPEMMGDILKSFGIPVYTNNFSTDDTYNNLLGYDINGNIYSTGSEYITQVVTSSAIPLSNNEINLQTYKRIYHNLPYLIKQKGTIEGLRTLITSYGIPDTILSISEFGGKDRINTNDWDYWKDKFNYKFELDGVNDYVRTEWVLHPDWNSNGDVPATLAFRFQTEEATTTTAPTYPSQSLWLGTSAPPSYSTTFSAITLTYTGSAGVSGSYSGSIVDPEYQYGTLTFYPDYSDLTQSASVYLPFFDGGWWSVMVASASAGYTVYAKNSIYSGSDGSSLGFQGSASITPSTDQWDNALYSLFGNTVGTFNRFSGSFQELRYYSSTLSESVFDDYVMNPSSIEGNSINSGPSELVFRGALGNELYTGSSSIHPKVTGSWVPTSSFNSNSTIVFVGGEFNSDTQTYFYDQFPAGIKNRNSNKIKQLNTIFPPSGSLYKNIPNSNTLSALASVQQTSYVSESYTDNVNYVEVAFSPQNQINDDIISQIGYFNLGEYIGDPRLVSSSAESYPELDSLRNSYFEKYDANYNWVDFIRLIKYYDNSLFKIIKDFTPARSGLASGIVIKQHLLERNKYPLPQETIDTVIATVQPTGSDSGSMVNFSTQDLIITGSSIHVSEITGSEGTNFYLNTSLNSFVYVNEGELGNAYPNYDLIIAGADPFDSSSYTGILWDNTTGTISLDPYISSTGSALVTFDIFASCRNAGDYPVDFVLSSSAGQLIQSTATLTAPSCSFEYYLDAGTDYYIYYLAADGNDGIDTSFSASGLWNYNNQYWSGVNDTKAGLVPYVHATEEEFYNGELSGSLLVVTTQSLNSNNPFLEVNTTVLNYTASITSSEYIAVNNFIGSSISNGQVYLYFDSSSVI